MSEVRDNSYEDFDEDFSDDDNLSGFDNPSSDDDFISDDEFDSDENLVSSSDEASDFETDDIEENESNEPSLSDSEAAELDTTPVHEIKPFLKTPLGMAVLGVGVLGLGMCGYTAYSLIGKQDSSADVPSPNTVAEKPVRVDVDFGVNDEQSDTVLDSLAVKNQDGGNLVTMAQGVQPVALPTQENGFPDYKKPFVDESVATKPDSRVDEIIASDKEQDKKLVLLENQQKGVEVRINELEKSIAKPNQQEADLLKGLDELKAEVAKLKADALAKEQATMKSKSGNEPVVTPIKENQHPKAKGRTRVVGLQVIDVTTGGEMAVVKQIKSDRVFTLFQNEQISTPKGRVKVTEVLEGGNLLLVGDHYYIDRVAVVEPKAAKRQAPEQAVLSNKKQASKPKEIKPVVDASGFSLNAIYDADGAFGIVTRKGEFLAVKKGDFIPELGIVEGIQVDGSLKVGNSRIKPVY